MTGSLAHTALPPVGDVNYYLVCYLLGVEETHARDFSFVRGF